MDRLLRQLTTMSFQQPKILIHWQPRQIELLLHGTQLVSQP